MALSPYQIDVLRTLAARRKAGGESYVAGGVALNCALATPRLSRDIDLFHDTAEALAVSWSQDRIALASAGHAVTVVRESPSFVEALVARGTQRVLVQWARDSAYRFFPLREDDQLGLTLHPLDLATNKALALVGRLEPRDWVDMLECHARLQPLGCLLWAACGKDPGYTPDFLVELAARQRYAQPELDTLAFDAPPPDASALSRRWKTAIAEAREIVNLLPPESAGTCVLSQNATPFVGTIDELRNEYSQNRLLFHPGRIGGVWPTLAH
jgi:hypothetical protein